MSATTRVSLDMRVGMADVAAITCTVPWWFVCCGSNGNGAYTHDVRGHLTRASFSDGRVQHRVADAVGNLFGHVERRDRVYAAGGALLHDGQRQYGYDGDGARVTRTGHDGTWRYAWSAAQELAAVERPDGVCVTFRYDALGRRVEKRVGERVVTYAWDGDDMIAERASDGGEVRWVYAPDAWTPLARSNGATMHAVLGDHVDSASEMYDAAGALAWRAQLDLYGVATEDVASVRCPWRNAGQYADDETGLYYNRFRYYDPQTGGYISKDPIGLLGGAALYAYVHDPLAWADPYALATKPFCKLQERVAAARKRGNVLISRFVSRAEAEAIQNKGRLVAHPHRQPTRVFHSEALLREKEAVGLELLSNSPQLYPLRIDIEVTPQTFEWIRRHSIEHQVDGHNHAYAIPRSHVGGMVTDGRGPTRTVQVHEPVEIQDR